MNESSHPEIINQLFSQFDMLTAAYQLEKIKTIGDCYIVVGGLPSPRADHAEAVADLALVLLDALERLPETGLLQHDAA